MHSSPAKRADDILSLIHIFVAYNHFHNLSSDSVMIMFWTSCVSNRLYRLTKRKSASDLITMIISLVILVFYVVKYFSQGW